MTDFPSFKGETDRQIVYVRAMRTADLPVEIQNQLPGQDRIYGIHSQDGECLALVSDRRQAFIVARQNALAPVSVH